ncbi:hypothetical protein TIFTF001_020182 [Ficus carica]|uniref:Uncharacterized protein n=1 Tax=Ficus carica TaxID=3494 RepID=A0AA88DAS8_FICCA|nr:hypothetical protein TIFTF001_020182 [Ficus carica]
MSCRQTSRQRPRVCSNLHGRRSLFLSPLYLSLFLDRKLTREDSSLGCRRHRRSRLSWWKLDQGKEIASKEIQCLSLFSHASLAVLRHVCLATLIVVAHDDDIGHERA